jgi:Uncharacterized protein conserved in bacteria
MLLTKDTDYDLIHRVFQKIYDVLPPKRAVMLEYADEETDIFDSKVGGVPYYPKEKEYPSGVFRIDEYLYTKDSKLPMMFVAQLNLEQLPHLDGYPEKGILQFYSMSDMNLAYDIDKMIDFKPDIDRCRNEFRVIYHENIINDREQLLSEDDFFSLFRMSDDLPESGMLLPVSLQNEDVRELRMWYYSRRIWRTDKPYKLKSKGIHTIYPTVDDYRFEPLFLKYYYAEKEYPLETVEEIRKIIYDESQKVNEYSDGMFGGYPYFTDTDPKNNRGIREYDTLLFEMMSADRNNINVEVNGEGTLSFFISKENLLKKNFSDVLIYSDSM